MSFQLIIRSRGNEFDTRRFRRFSWVRERTLNAVEWFPNFVGRGHESFEISSFDAWDGIAFEIGVVFVDGSVIRDVDLS